MQLQEILFYLSIYLVSAVVTHKLLIKRQQMQLNAAIITCGGICPGLNAVIRSIFLQLKQHQIKKVYGIRFGWGGLSKNKFFELSDLDFIHQYGGTILGSSRGGFDLDCILDKLLIRQINLLFVIGGDGTHRAIKVLAEEVQKRGLKQIRIVGIPKTIDNDIPSIDLSFGFRTAVDYGVRAIARAEVWANSTEYGVALVRIMGRYHGFLGVECLGCSQSGVDFFILPETRMFLYGQNGLINKCYQRIKSKRCLLIVIGDGSSKALLDYDFSIMGYDQSGNPKFQDMAGIFREEFGKCCEKAGLDVEFAYFDSSYDFKNRPANCVDQILCAELGEEAVDYAMRSERCATVGLCRGKVQAIEVASLLVNRKILGAEDIDEQIQRIEYLE